MGGYGRYVTVINQITRSQHSGRTVPISQLLQWYIKFLLCRPVSCCFQTNRITFLVITVIVEVTEDQCLNCLLWSLKIKVYHCVLFATLLAISAEKDVYTTLLLLLDVYYFCFHQVSRQIFAGFLFFHLLFIALCWNIHVVHHWVGLVWHLSIQGLIYLLANWAILTLLWSQWEHDPAGLLAAVSHWLKKRDADISEGWW